MVNNRSILQRQNVYVDVRHAAERARERDRGYVKNWCDTNKIFSYDALGSRFNFITSIK